MKLLFISSTLTLLSLSSSGLCKPVPASPEQASFFQSKRLKSETDPVELTAEPKRQVDVKVLNGKKEQVEPDRKKLIDKEKELDSKPKELTEKIKQANESKKKQTELPRLTPTQVQPVSLQDETQKSNGMLISALFISLLINIALLFYIAFPKFFGGTSHKNLKMGKTLLNEQPQSVSPSSQSPEENSQIVTDAIINANSVKETPSSRAFTLGKEQNDEPVQDFILPEILQTPFPKLSKNEGYTVFKHKETEDILSTVRQNNRKFDKLCAALLNEKGDKRRHDFMLETAKSFLKKNGNPDKNSHEPISELINSSDNDHYFFIGDVHGSLTGLIKVFANIIRMVQKNKGHNYTAIFLGDILDRGKNTLETLAMVLYIRDNKLTLPNLKTVILRGNHDEGLAYRDDHFLSSVSPAETVDELNSLIDEGQKDFAVTMGHAAIRLAQISPCMGEITGIKPENPEFTLLFCHGGVPHVDLQEELDKKEEIPNTSEPVADKYATPYLKTLPKDLQEKFARDYTWIRLVDKVPHKHPNRGTSGCQIGTEDVNQYRKQHWRRTGRAISFIIRGHDHEAAGYRLYSHDGDWPDSPRGKFVQKNCGVLTINTMEPDSSSSGIFSNRALAFAHFQQGDVLDLCILKNETLQLEEVEENTDSTEQQSNATI